MTRTIILITLTIFAISACNNSEQSNMTNSKSNEQSKEPISDSISGYALVNGLKMYYEIHGSGMPLVLIHGGGSTIQSTFGRVLQLFAKNHKVIAVELQAHGHTPDIDRPLSFKQDAGDVAELLNQLGISKADIFGFSNGASTTLELAIRHPDVVNKIIVASTFYKKAGAPSWFWEMMANPSFEQMPQQLKEAYLDANPDTNGLHIMYQRDVARMQSFTDISEENFNDIKVPALIIIGDKDVVLPEHAVEMYHKLPGARLAIIPGGHGDYIGEITTPQDSTLVAATVLMIEKFLNEPGN